MLRFLVDQNNGILEKLKSDRNVELATVSCNEIVDAAMLVAVDKQVSML
jgi:hypothetical protein